MKIKNIICVLMFVLVAGTVSAWEFNFDRINKTTNETIQSYSVEITEDLIDFYGNNYTELNFTRYNISESVHLVSYEFWCQNLFNPRVLSNQTITWVEENPLTEQNVTINKTIFEYETCSYDLYKNRYIRREVILLYKQKFRPKLTPINELREHFEIVEDNETTLIRAKDGMIVGTILTETTVPKPDTNYMKRFFDRTSLWDKLTHYAYTIFKGKDTLDMEKRIENLEGALSQLAVETCAESNNKYTWCSLECLDDEYWDSQKNKCVKYSK